MPPKRSVTPSAASASMPPTPSKPTTTTTTTSSTSAAQSNDASAILTNIWKRYVSTTPQRTKLLDVFLAFLVVVGVLQFAYCVIGGNYPFNAFLSGFSATVGQFVLTASLRMQTDPGNAKEFRSVGPERAFADYILGSLILHFFCVNFIN